MTSDRQSLVVNNMANIDTPGYHTQDIDSACELQRAIGSSGTVRRITTVAHKVNGTDRGVLTVTTSAWTRKA